MTQGPWDYDAETLSIYRQYAKLHMQLYPYLRRLTHEATHRGLPPMRPMPLAFQTDAQACAHDLQYMLGEALLVVPVVSAELTRSVYLPLGSDDAAPQQVEWVDFWTGHTMAGGQTVQVEVPLERIPLYVRPGSVIELLPPEVNTLVTASDVLGGVLDASVVPLGAARVLQVCARRLLILPPFRRP
jgi:alpha-D-xyloside xylohydrolase